MIKRVVVVTLVLIVVAVSAWLGLRFRNSKRLDTAAQSAIVANTARVDTWSEAVEKVKADRDEALRTPVVTPPELQHYSERHWFLATQVAEITKYNIPVCQDYLQLAAMIQRGELVSVPGVTETYVLYGVAQRVDDGDFTSDDEANLLLRFGDSQLTEGATGNVSISMVEAGPPLHRFEIFGERGGLKIEGDGELWQSNVGDGSGRKVEVDRGELASGMSDNGWARGFTVFSQKIVGALLEGRTTVEGAATFEDGYRTQLVLDAARKSNESGCREKLNLAADERGFR